jgi:D-hydroxyproline dehydrogenase subunit alpha
MKPRPVERCDIAVVGAGPAGMAAAVAAAQSGMSVVVIDDNPLPGGQIWRDGPAAALPELARQWRAALNNNANISLFSGAQVVAAPAAHQLLLEDAQHAWRLGWKKLILCTGGRELLLPFPGWTLPGVTGAGALQALIKSGVSVAGERIVIAGSGPLLLASAATAQRAGAKVLLVAEQAPFSAVASFATGLARWPAKALQALALSCVTYRTGSHVVSVQGVSKVASVQIQRGAHTKHVECERVACGYGLVPNTGLAQALSCSLNSVGVHAQGIAVDALQATTVEGIFAAGECTGIGGSERALAQGSIAGYAASGNAAKAATFLPELARWELFATRLANHFSLGSKLRTLPEASTLVCRCEDVSYASIAQCSSFIDAKLHTRCGMGACQGRVCSAATSFLFGWAPPVPRPPFSPARVATLAGLTSSDSV